MSEEQKSEISSVIYKATNLFLLRHWDKTAYGAIFGSGLWALSKIFAPAVAAWTIVNKEALTVWNLILGCVFIVNLPSIIGSLFNKKQFRPEIEEGYQYIDRLIKDKNLNTEQAKKLHVFFATKVIKSIQLNDDTQSMLDKMETEAKRED